jgi:hypothetical protein
LNFKALEGGTNTHTSIVPTHDDIKSIAITYALSCCSPNLFSKIESITFSSESNTGRNLLLKSQNTCEWQAGSTTFTARPPAILHHGRTGHKTREVDMETQK